MMQAMHKAGLGTPEAEAIRAEAKKRKAARTERRRQRWIERQARRANGMLPSSVGFANQPQTSEAPLEQQFREGTIRDKN